MIDDITSYPWVATSLCIVLIISCLCSMFVISSYFMFKDLRQGAFRLVFWMAFSDFMCNALTFMTFRTIDATDDDHHVSTYCSSEAFLKQYFATASVLWPVVIALSLYAAVVLRGIHTEEGDDVSYLVQFTESEASVHSFVWFISLTCSVLPLTTNSYGSAGMWCWIKDSDDIDNVATLWRFVTFYFIVWFGFLISSIVYYYVFKALRLVIRMSQSTIDENVNVTVLLRLMRTLKYYPLIFLTSWIPLTAYRIIETIYPTIQNNKNMTLTFVIWNGSSIQGILTAFAFGTTPSVKRHWCAYFQQQELSGPDGDGDSSSGCSPTHNHNSINSSGKSNDDRVNDDRAGSNKHHYINDSSSNHTRGNDQDQASGALYMRMEEEEQENEDEDVEHYPIPTKSHSKVSSSVRDADVDEVSDDRNQKEQSIHSPLI